MQALLDPAVSGSFRTRQRKQIVLSEAQKAAKLQAQADREEKAEKAAMKREAAAEARKRQAIREASRLILGDEFGNRVGAVRGKRPRRVPNKLQQDGSVGDVDMGISSQHARQLPAEPRGHAEAVQDPAAAEGAPPAIPASTLAATNGVVPTTTNTGTGTVSNASMANTAVQQPKQVTAQDEAAAAQPQGTRQAARASSQHPQAAGEAPSLQQADGTAATFHQSAALPEASAGRVSLPQITQQMGEMHAENMLGGVQQADAMLEEAVSTLQHASTADKALAGAGNDAKPAAEDAGRTLQHARPAAENVMAARHRAAPAGEGDLGAQRQDDSHTSSGMGVEAAKKGSKAGNKFAGAPCPACGCTSCPQWRSPVKQQDYVELGNKVCNGCWTDLSRRILLKAPYWWQQTGSGQPPLKRTCARIGTSASGRLAQPVNPSLHQVSQQPLPAVAHAPAAGHLKAASTTASAQTGNGVAGQSAQGGAQHSGPPEQKLQQTIAAKVNHAAAQQQAVNRAASSVAETAAAAAQLVPVRQVMSVGQAQVAGHYRAAPGRGKGSLARADASHAARAADARLQPADQQVGQHRSVATAAASNATEAIATGGKKPSARTRHATADNKQRKASIAKQHNTLIAAADPAAAAADPAAAAAAMKVTATLVKTAKAAIKGAASVKQAAVANRGGEAASKAAVSSLVAKVAASTAPKAAAKGRRPAPPKAASGHQNTTSALRANTARKGPAGSERQRVGTGPMDSQLQLGAVHDEAEEQAVAALLALGSASRDITLHQPEGYAAGKASGAEEEIGLHVPPVVAAMQTSAERHFAALFRTQIVPAPGTAVQMDPIEPCDAGTALQKPHGSQTLSVLGSSAQRLHTKAPQPAEAPSKRKKRDGSDLDAPDEVLGKRQRMKRTAAVFHFSVGAGVPVGLVLLLIWR